jgi:hypothetical protein
MSCHFTQDYLDLSCFSDLILQVLVNDEETIELILIIVKS